MIWVPAFAGMSGNLGCGVDRLAKAARGKTGLSQDKFAAAYGINVARLRDLEQGRKEPDRVLVSLLALIADDPAKVRRVLMALTSS